ncbi:MAG: bifunctional metallophosphatase/5'-nucleotidase [Firmicutes bacterium]|nr:bifunctional metallophosphatase/5'-nucleotidase [Bacillota bacterium]
MKDSYSKEDDILDRTFKIRILFTSDSHGSLLDLNYSNNQLVDYGMVKIASLIKKYRTKSTVLIDGGDTIQGSPLLYYHQLHRNNFSHPVATIFNQLKYDFFVPGNHDFNYGIDYLNQFTRELHSTTLCANILTKEHNLYFDKAYEIRNYPHGVKVAFIGLTTQYIPNWEQPSNIKDLEFVNVIDKLKEVLAEIKSTYSVQGIVVIYHGGFEKELDTLKDYVSDTGENLGSKILETFPEINVLLTGHQHRLISQNVKQTTVIQPGSYGKYLGLIDISFSKNKTWSLDKIESQILSSQGVLSDRNLAFTISDIEDATQLFLDQTIGTVPNNDLKIEDLFQARLHKHKIVTFINQVQLLASKADISCTSLGNAITGFDKEITVRNVLSTYIYPNTLTVIQITGEKLRKALEKNAEYFVIENNEIVANPKYSYPKLEHYNYDMFDGIDYEFDISKEFGFRVISMTFKKKDIKDEDVFTLVMNNYRATGGGEFEMYKGLPILKEMQFDIAELLINYIREHKELVIPDIHNIHIHK